MSFNIELKARCPNLASFEKKAQALSATLDGIDHQIDTFFNVPKGRLKLRESTLYGNFLIPYLRPDSDGPKRSDYSLLAVDNPEQTKELLQQMFGILVIIKKERKIYLHKNVRLHLDQVEGLGPFIEFEAVMNSDETEEDNQEKLDQLIRYFAISEKDFVSNAYADLLLRNE